MDKNIAALLRIDHTQLANFGPIVPGHMNQSLIAHLSAHPGVERRAIHNDIHFIRFFARENGFDDCFRLEKIVAEKFRRRDFARRHRPRRRGRPGRR